MNTQAFYINLLWCIAGLLITSCQQPRYITMDMVYHNPGEVMTKLKYLDPSFLKENGYGAKVFFLFEAAQFEIDQ